MLALCLEISTLNEVSQLCPKVFVPRATSSGQMDDTKLKTFDSSSAWNRFCDLFQEFDKVFTHSIILNGSLMLVKTKMTLKTDVGVCEILKWLKGKLSLRRFCVPQRLPLRNHPSWVRNFAFDFTVISILIQIERTKMICTQKSSYDPRLQRPQE
jgi:hypothetical protein